MNNGGSNMRKGDSMIPNNIIEDVLMKLPSKTICRFGIACKTWYSLISDPVFINLHSKRALSENPKILLYTVDAQFRLLDYESSSFDHSCLSASPIKSPVKSVTFIGSNCGLVCVVAHESRGNSFCVWNPLTGQSRKIPKPDNYHISLHSYRYGFGYDSVANDFKIVMLSIGNSEANIFSLKANLWKQIVIATPLGFTTGSVSAMHTPAVYSNGLFYWIVLRDNNSYEIVAFDEAKETFEKLQLQLPESGSAYGKSGDCVSLLEHRGCLCFSFSKVRSYQNDIWMMMKECGWVHLITIVNSERFNGYKMPTLFLCISTRDQVVFHTDNKFSRCGSREEDKFEFDEIHMSPYVRGTVMYVETLVSPNCPYIKQ